MDFFFYNVFDLVFVQKVLKQQQVMGVCKRFIEHTTETHEDSNRTIVEAVSLSVFQHFTPLTVPLLTCSSAL